MSYQTMKEYCQNCQGHLFKIFVEFNGEVYKGVAKCTLCDEENTYLSDNITITIGDNNK